MKHGNTGKKRVGNRSASKGKGVPTGGHPYGSVDVLLSSHVVLPSGRRIPVAVRVWKQWLEGQLPETLVVTAKNSSDEPALSLVGETCILECCGVVIRAQAGPFVGSWLFVRSKEVFAALTTALMQQAKSREGKDKSFRKLAA